MILGPSHSIFAATEAMGCAEKDQLEKMCTVASSAKDI